MIVALWIAAVASFALALLRWLRVAQREHYLSWTVTRFAFRWWNSHAVNLALFLAGLVTLGLAMAYPAAGFATALVVMIGPLGLGVSGRTAPLRWTVRMRRLAVGVAIITGGFIGLGALVGRPAPFMLVAALFMALIVDVALLGLMPVEYRLSRRFVDDAVRTLARVDPTVVAITGSYGKTTTKAYLVALLADRRPTVASPASFNNRLGLARAVNEHLTQGTEIFIAEMGTYQKGEIADLCSWIEPAVGVITAIGPVHLERCGSLDAILEAKAEILERAHTAVLNVDDPRLAALADRIQTETIRCSIKNPEADVYVNVSGDVSVRGETVAFLEDASVHPDNLACAFGALLAIDAPVAGLSATINNLPGPAHRQSVTTGDLGFTIVDDTYNSNPAGARSALATLERVGSGGRRVLVTPGMVELGNLQYEENLALAKETARRVTDVVIVGRTNRSAWLEGTAAGDASVIVVDSREEAVEWVRANLTDRDAVLYENDLPDHYP